MTRRIAVYICRALYVVRFWHLVLLLERAFGWRHHAVVLLYHHIRRDGETLPPLSEVEEGVSQSDLEMQLREFVRWYKPLKPGELHAAINKADSLSADGLLVTFDDAYSDNRTLAGPVLRRYGLIGLIFVATGYIESTRRFWWTRINDIVRAMNEETLAFIRASANGSSRLSPVLASAKISDHRQRRDFRVRVAATLERLNESEQQTELDRLESSLYSTPTNCLPLLNWSEMRTMAGEAFEFGAHTVTHPKLTKRSRVEVQRELTECVDTLCHKTGVRPSTFAYPYGDLNADVEDEVQRAGFDAAYAANPGIVVPGRTNRFKIPRIQLGPSDPLQLTLWIVALKSSKYFPRLMAPMLSRLFGQPFALAS